MGHVVIIKLGSTLPALAGRGDFEDWIQAGLGLDGADVRVIDAIGGAELPSPRGLAGAVLTGSASMVTEHLPWSERVAAWLREVVSTETPVLGICYGHQLLAYALGGVVGYNPRGREMGTTEVHLLGAASGDRLLGHLPPVVAVQTSHAQSVLRLPPGATRLAANARDEHHAFVLGSAWGMQFHPEFDAAVMRGYLTHYASKLRVEGADPEALLSAVKETPESVALLGRFGWLIAQRGGRR